MKRLILAVLVFFSCALTGCSTFVDSPREMGYYKKIGSKEEVKVAYLGGFRSLDGIEEELKAIAAADGRIVLVDEEDEADVVNKLLSFYFGTRRSKGTSGVNVADFSNGAASASVSAGLAGAAGAASSGLVVAGGALALLDMGLELAGKFKDSPTYYYRFSSMMKRDDEASSLPLFVAHTEKDLDEDKAENVLAKKAAILIYKHMLGEIPLEVEDEMNEMAEKSTDDERS